MRNTWTHLMVSDTFYFIVDDTVFCPKDDKHGWQKPLGRQYHD